jgi:hypothetical protein
MVLAEGAEAEMDAAIARQREFDPDLWVIEVEDRAGRHLLDHHEPPRRIRTPRLASVTATCQTPRNPGSMNG